MKKVIIVDISLVILDLDVVYWTKVIKN